jgi:signal peptidase II
MQRRHWQLFALALAGCVGCDHATKRVAEAWLGGSGGHAFAGDVVQFQLAENPGAFLSIGAGLPEPVRHWILLGMVPLLIAFVCLAFAWRAQVTRGQALALACVAGGGLANWLDRVLNDGYVTDFVSLGIGPLRTGIFNLADLAVVGGVGALLWLTRTQAPAPPAESIRHAEPEHGSESG